MSQNTVSVQLSIDEAKRVKDVLLSFGWKDADINNEYIALRMKSEEGSVVTLTQAGRLFFKVRKILQILFKLYREVVMLILYHILV